MKKTILRNSLFALTCIILLFSALLYAVNVTLVKSYTKSDVISQIKSKQLMLADMHSLLYDAIKKNIDPLLSDYNLFLLADSTFASREYFSKATLDRLYEVKTAINSIKISDSRIRSVYVHFLVNDYIISSEHFAQSTEDFYDRHWVESIRDYRQNGELPLFLMGRVDFENEYTSWHYDCVRYIFEYRGYFANEKVLIVVNYDTNALDSMLSSDERNDTMLLNSSLAPFYTSVKDDSTKALIEDNLNIIAQSISDTEPFLLFGEHIVTSVNDEYGNYFLNISDYRSLTTAYDWLLLIIFALIAAVTLIAALIWYITAVRIYSPVNRAVQNIYRLSDNLKLGNQEDDFTIDEAVERLVARVKNQELMEREENFFNAVLNHEEIEHQNDYLNKSRFCGIQILLDERRFHEANRQTEEIILNVITSLLYQGGLQGIGRIAQRDCFDFLLSFDSDAEPGPDESPTGPLFDVLDGISDKIFDICGRTVTIGVGDVYSSARYLPLSLEEARQRSERKMLLGKGKIITESDDGSSVYLPEAEVSRILDAIKTGDEDAVAAIYEKIRRQVTEEGDILISVENIPLFVYYMLFSISQYVTGSGTIEPINYESVARINEFETFDEILDFLCQWTIALIREMKTNQVNELDILHRASLFIRENYTKDIDVNTIAENVGASYSRLRKVILKELGVNIVDYINSLRIKKAKDLLIETDLNIADIAVQAGYNNEQSLGRYFKKFEGCTPGEYRKNHR